MTPPRPRPAWDGWDLLGLFVVSQIAALGLVGAGELYAEIVRGGRDPRALEQAAVVSVNLFAPLAFLALEWGLLSLRRAWDAARSLYGGRPELRLFAWGLGGGILAKVASDAVGWLESRFVARIEENNPLLTHPGAFSQPELVIGLALSVAVVVPLAEELFYRGLLFTLLRRFGFWPAALASSLLFGAAHGAPTLVLPLAVAGFAFAALFEATKSLWVPTVAHATFNATALVLALLSWPA